MRMLFTARSKNIKTGDIPQGYMGETVEEARKSCFGCPLEEKKCYYWKRYTANASHRSMMRANKKNPARYDLENVLPKSSRMARYIRIAVGGAPSEMTRKTVEGIVSQVKKFGMKGALGYTHFFDGKGAHLKGLVMASVDSLTDADRAVDAGWRAAATLPFRLKGVKLKKFAHLPEWNGEEIKTPDGRRVVVCPAQRPELRKDCNTCGLCDATSHERVEVIGFLMH